MTDILLVEDHTELNELMRIFLEKEGYSVKGVCSGEEALEFLKTEKRTEIAERIKVALGFGDLSENSEYDEAKSAQAANENKIAELENKIRYAKIIDESEIDTKTVQIGNIVTLHDVEFDEEIELTAVIGEKYYSVKNEGGNTVTVGSGQIDITGSKYVFDIYFRRCF